MTNHEQRMNDREWSVGDTVWVEVYTSEEGFERFQAEVVACESESMDSFEVVWVDHTPVDSQDHDRVPGSWVVGRVGEES